MEHSVDLIDKMSTPQVVRILSDAYQNSEYAMQTLARIHEITQMVRSPRCYNILSVTRYLINLDLCKNFGHSEIVYAYFYRQVLLR